MNTFAAVFYFAAVKMPSSREIDDPVMEHNGKNSVITLQQHIWKLGCGRFQSCFFKRYSIVSQLGEL